jgi:predicted cobalt transporter CbtA
MFVLDSYRNSPDLDAVNAAFDEWLRIGRQADWVEATILTALAAGVVLLLWRRNTSLSTVETISIVAVFIVGMMWRDRSADVEAPLATAALVFGSVLAAAKVRQFLGNHRARGA